MKHEKLTCPKKLEELLKKFIAPGVTLSVNTVKESACSTPTIESVGFTLGNEFVILNATPYSGLGVRVKPTPKLIKKVRISGELAGRPVSQVFLPGDYTHDFEDALTKVVKEEFEEPEEEVNA